MFGLDLLSVVAALLGLAMIFFSIWMLPRWAEGDFHLSARKRKRVRELKQVAKANGISYRDIPRPAWGPGA